MKQYQNIKTSIPKPIKNKINQVKSFLVKSNNNKIPKLNANDTFLVSYPKSGNTWVRFLFANYLKNDTEKLITFKNFDHYCPEWNIQNELISKLSSPRIIKSHDKFNSLFPKVIYIVRDGRDVYLSYYHYLKNSFTQNLSFKEFLESDNIPQGRWSEHIESWILNQHNNINLKLIKYEDLQHDPFSLFSEMVEFAGFEVHKERIEMAIQNSSFKQMKSIEQQYGKKARKNTPEIFVRKGISNQWKQEFGKEELEIFKRKENIQLLEKLGYID